MPSYNEFYEHFENLVGTGDYTDAWYGREVGGFAEWHEIWESIGVTGDDAGELRAFDEFIHAFYPEEGLSGDDWDIRRERFYEMTGAIDADIDWEAWREAIGY